MYFRPTQVGKEGYLADREVWKRFRANLQTAMKRKGVTARELAHAADIWPATISHWLHDGSLPNSPTLVRVAHALGLEAADLLPGAGPALPRRSGTNPSDYAIGWRDALDEVELTIRDLRERPASREARAKVAEEHYGELESVRKSRKRQSKGS